MIVRPWLTLLALALAALTVGAAPAPDPLPRKAFFGAALAPVTEEARQRQKLDSTDGVLLREVLPASSAQAAGLRAEDVILAVNGAKVAGVPAFLQTIASGKVGDTLALEIARGGERRTERVTLRERPREQSDTLEVIYGAVESRGARLRTVVTRPKGEGRKPALLFIQGLGCATVDNPGGAMASYREIPHALTRAGYVVMRVDKPGAGDSEGGPCGSVDFETEMDGYRQALRALKAMEFVDPENVFIFGHSMGGVFGPLLAAETPVKGVAVFGTVLKPWFEYVLENARRQELLAGRDPADIERTNRAQAAFSHYLFVEKKTPQQVAEVSPEMREYVQAAMPDGATMFGRHYRFFQQLAARNMAEAWQKVRAHTLALWGRGDFVSGADDHALIARIVEKAHPGAGRYVALDMDHAFARAASEEEAFRQGLAGGPFNPAIIETLRGWMDEKAKAPAVR